MRSVMLMPGRHMGSSRGQAPDFFFRSVFLCDMGKPYYSVPLPFCASSLMQTVFVFTNSRMP